MPRNPAGKCSEACESSTARSGKKAWDEILWSQEDWPWCPSAFPWWHHGRSRVSWFESYKQGRFIQGPATLTEGRRDHSACKLSCTMHSTRRTRNMMKLAHLGSARLLFSLCCTKLSSSSDRLPWLCSRRCFQGAALYLLQSTKSVTLVCRKLLVFFMFMLLVEMLDWCF